MQKLSSTHGAILTNFRTSYDGYFGDISRCYMAILYFNEGSVAKSVWTTQEAADFLNADPNYWQSGEHSLFEMLFPECIEDIKRQLFKKG